MERARGGGFCRTFVRFVAVITIRSVWVSARVLNFVGNNSTVSDILSLPVSVT
jgi:hypothetical protein